MAFDDDSEIYFSGVFNCSCNIGQQWSLFVKDDIKREQLYWSAEMSLKLLCEDLTQSN